MSVFKQRVAEPKKASKPPPSLASHDSDSCDNKIPVGNTPETSCGPGQDEASPSKFGSQSAPGVSKSEMNLQITNYPSPKDAHNSRPEKSKDPFLAAVANAAASQRSVQGLNERVRLLGRRWYDHNEYPCTGDSASEEGSNSVKSFQRPPPLRLNQGDRNVGSDAESRRSKRPKTGHVALASIGGHRTQEVGARERGAPATPPTAQRHETYPKLSRYQEDVLAATIEARLQTQQVLEASMQAQQAHHLARQAAHFQQPREVQQARQLAQQVQQAQKQAAQLAQSQQAARFSHPAALSSTQTHPQELLSQQAQSSIDQVLSQLEPQNRGSPAIPSPQHAAGYPAAAMATSLVSQMFLPQSGAMQTADSQPNLASLTAALTGIANVAAFAICFPSASAAAAATLRNVAERNLASYPKQPTTPESQTTAVQHFHLAKSIAENLLAHFARNPPKDAGGGISHSVNSGKASSVLPHSSQKTSQEIQHTPSASIGSVDCGSAGNSSQFQEFLRHRLTTDDLLASASVSHKCSDPRATKGMSNDEKTNAVKTRTNLSLDGGLNSSSADVLRREESEVAIVKQAELLTSRKRNFLLAPTKPKAKHSSSLNDGFKVACKTDGSKQKEVPGKPSENSTVHTTLANDNTTPRFDLNEEYSSSASDDEGAS
ncbi:hypothetical protein CYMTET_53620 [Cymbomonas tetramitiformis]|uniref:Uncharacterized protein n=1 Tax=Cymbomonas tetramitiformis TaxID=36881 RepID=A0AAE0BHQ7_9CHLO|nr:hypothetical protein CYMTET_53620 [Cymbomonas tetramitiformis]